MALCSKLYTNINSNVVKPNNNRASVNYDVKMDDMINEENEFDKDNNNIHHHNVHTNHKYTITINLSKTHKQIISDTTSFPNNKHQHIKFHCISL